MKKNIKFIIISFIFIVFLYPIVQSNEVQAVSSEEAGKYLSEFAINFFDAHASETTYGTSGRTAAYEGKKTNGVYNFDCVGWLGFAIHQSLGLGADYYSEFAVPYHGNPNPGYFNGYTQVYGSGGSSKSIPLDELKSQLKPGDLLMATGPRKHVLLYVGDGTLIHSTGHGPGLEYGGDKGYGIVKETLDHFYEGYGIESVGRLTEDASASINESNLTTIFGETGQGLTGIWQKASNGNSTSGWDTSSGTSTSPSASDKFSVSGMNEDYNLGLRYPKDNKNTPLNSFIDFTAPFLQTWMIPLAMNAGAVNSAKGTDISKNPIFSYITIKEAMSDILVNRYDITKCTVKTRYKVYDVITYEVTHDKKGEKSTKEVSRYKVDESTNGPMSEQFISKSFDVSTKYCIKKAYTFDVKIDNEYEYEPYNDNDVENRLNPDIEQKENGESYNEGGDPGGEGDYTYTKKEGNYINVTRTWQDKFQTGDSHIEEYTVNDVREYVSDSSNSSYNLSGETYECTKYELTEEQKIRLAKIVYAEYGADIEGMKAIASHMANLYEHRRWSKAISQSKSLYDFISTTTWYDSRSRNNNNYNDDAVKAVEECIINGKRVMPPYIDEFCTFSSKYISPYYKDINKYDQGKTKVRQLFSGSPEGTFWMVTPTDSGGNIFFYTSEKFKEYCEGKSNSLRNNNNDNDEDTKKIDTSNLDYFTIDDINYYELLYTDKSINRVDLVNARPENYLQYLEKGSQYSNHVGYSRGYLVFGYDELKKLFKEKFEERDSLPFVYGSSLGYNTYTAKNEIDAGTINGEGITVPGSVNVPDGLGKSHTWTIWNHVNENSNPESTWPKGSSQADLILHLTNNNERSLHGELSGDITANSKRMVCYGEWLASAMVSQLGGTQGNPEKILKLGDLVFIIQDNGTVYPVILTDTKVQFNSTSWDSNPANEWGHDNGQSMVEFQGYTSSWRDVPATPSEFNHYIKQVYVVGNVYTNPEYLNNIEKAAKDVGIDTSKLINPKKM